MSYVESKLVNSAGKMAKLLGTDLFLDGQGTQSTPVQLDGMLAGLDDGTAYPTYAGITRSDIATGANQGINAYKATPTGGLLSLASVQTAYGSAWFGNEHVDLIVTDQPTWDIFWNKIQPQQRFMDESSDVAKIGYEAFKYNGATVVVDQYNLAGYMWLLNTKYIQFWISTHPKYQFGQMALRESDLPKNGGEFGERCDANPEPSIASKVDAKARVETMGRPPASRDEDIVRSAGKEEPAGEPFTGWKEAGLVLGFRGDLCQGWKN